MFTNLEETHSCVNTGNHVQQLPSVLLFLACVLYGSDLFMLTITGMHESVVYDSQPHFDSSDGVHVVAGEYEHLYPLFLPLFVHVHVVY